MSATKQNALTLAEKVDLIKASERPGVRQSELVAKFNASKSQVSRILKNKAKIIEEFESCGTNKRRKRNRSGKEEDVGNALLIWLRQKLAQGARLDGALLRAKASEIALEKGVDFEPSGTYTYASRIVSLVQLCSLK